MIDTITLPAGKYLIGDLCYRDDQLWDEMIDNIDGKVHKLSDGRQYVILDTAYGDGTYYDFDNNSYWVDSGTIGIMKWDGPDMQEAMGRTFDFNSDFAVFEDGGDLHFGAMVIETKAQDEETDMDDGYDHGPTEYQEWHDYDADC
jgi:hypothetical protein